MTAQEKTLRGVLYDANNDPVLVAEREEVKYQLKRYSALEPRDIHGRTMQLKALLGKTGENLLIEQPFYCDYEHNIEEGENFYANVNLVILDDNNVVIGNNVFIGLGVGLPYGRNPLNAQQRIQGLEYALPITIGDNVWIGAGVSIVPGITIGNNSVIGAGSVVMHDIPDNVVAAGTPSHVIKIIEQDNEGVRT